MAPSRNATRSLGVRSPQLLIKSPPASAEALFSTAEIGSVAAGAVGLIVGAPGSGLSRRVDCRRSVARSLGIPRQRNQAARKIFQHASPPIAKTNPTERRRGPSRYESGHTTRLCAGWPTASGVSSTDPVMVPLVALEIVRSAMAGPLTPAATALCRLAVVAAESNPSKEPVIASFVPSSTAETEPEPARAGARLGVGRQCREARLKCFTALRGKQESERANPIPITATATRRLNVISTFRSTSLL